ncbi:hypothetical protein NDU88_002167 [Pleurodeles waltl]|uniref:Uncharacterized protein n=1 Tax=Pleurodeles waltl TaxID=8319 RepID=A0AAV7M572_PLEWA|nr:hypothetical protein NDU88_002167 [Pleurodeles waltl]
MEAGGNYPAPMIETLLVQQFSARGPHRGHAHALLTLGVTVCTAVRVFTLNATVQAALGPHYNIVGSQAGPSTALISVVPRHVSFSVQGEQVLQFPRQGRAQQTAGRSGPGKGTAGHGSLHGGVADKIGLPGRLGLSGPLIGSASRSGPPSPVAGCQDPLAPGTLATGPRHRPGGPPAAARSPARQDGGSGPNRPQ